MRELGYVEHRNFDMAYRYSEGFQDRLPGLAAELVRLKPDIIVAASVVTAVAARKFTSTIPIVSAALADSVHLGLAASESHPGGNVTGIKPYVAGLPAEQMQLAHQLVLGASVVGILTDVDDPRAPPQVQEMAAAGSAVGIKTIVAGASRPDDCDRALQELANGRANASAMALSRHRSGVRNRSTENGPSLDRQVGDGLAQIAIVVDHLVNRVPELQQLLAVGAGRHCDFG
jgi:putative ABC transport system substrate-binding protein